MVKISEEKRKAFGDYMRETLGSVNSQDEDFFNRDLVQGVGGESTAEKHGTRFVILIIIEIIASIVISATTEIDGEIIWWVTIFVLLKDIAIILILNKIHDEDREAQIE